MAVEPTHAHHAGLVVARRRAEDVARQRHSRREDFVEGPAIVFRQRHQRRRGGRRDGVENPQQRIRMTLGVAFDQLGIVEVVAGVHPHSRGRCGGARSPSSGQAPAHGDFLVLVEQGNLHAVHLGRVAGNNLERDLHRLVVVRMSPVSGQRRIEHLAQPVDDHRLPDLAEDALVDLVVIVRRLGHARQRPAGHEDNAAAERFDRGDLLLVGADHVVQARGGFRGQMVGAGAACQQCAFAVAARLDRAANELERGVPIKAHAALRRVHGLGHAQAQPPQGTAIGDGRVPVDGAALPRIDRRQRIGHHMGGAIGDATERAGGLAREVARNGKPELFQPPARHRQFDAYAQFLRCIHHRLHAAISISGKGFRLSLRVWRLTLLFWARPPSAARPSFSVRSPPAAPPSRPRAGSI